MRTFLTLTCVAITSAAAWAQTPHYLDLFFTADPTEFGTIPVLDVPTPPAGPYTLAAGSGTWLALWTKSPGQWQQFVTTYKEGSSTKTWVYTDWAGDVWERIGSNFVDAGQVLDQANSWCSQAGDGLFTPYRWDPQSNFLWNSAGPTGGFDVFATADDHGIGKRPFAADQITDVPIEQLDTPGYLYTILGFAHIVDTARAYPKNLFFTVGTNGIVRRNGTANDDYVRFGHSTPILGQSAGAVGDQAMLRVIPEPGALVLLVFAGLAVRRR